MTTSPTRRAPRKSAASPTAAKKAAAKRAVPPSNDEFVGRMAELAAEVRKEPFQVTATLFIEPPDQIRSQTIASSQTAYIIAKNQLDALVQPLPDETTKDNILRDDAGNPVFPDIDTKILENLQKVVNDAALEYDKALFGDAYDAVVERFQHEQGAVWNAFYDMVTDYFLPIIKDGKCPTCGQGVTPSAEGNEDESSTSSSDTGTT